MAENRTVDERRYSRSELEDLFGDMTINELHYYTTDYPECPIFYQYMMQYMPPEKVSELLEYENVLDN